MWANPKIPFVIKELRPGGIIQADPIIPVQFTFTGDTNGLQKGEVLQCEIVREETRKGPDGSVVEDRSLVCNDHRRLRVRSVIFQVAGN